MSTKHLIAFVSSLQTIGSEENQGLADFGVIQYYGWKKVTIFQLDVDSFENVRFPVRPYHPKSNDGCLRVIIETTQAGNRQTTFYSCALSSWQDASKKLYGLIYLYLADASSL